MQELKHIENMRVAHIAAQLTAHILAPDPDAQPEQRVSTLIEIVASGESSARTSITAVAYAGYLITRHIDAQEVEHSVDDIISEMTINESAPVAYDIGVGFARRALDNTDDDSAATAVTFAVNAFDDIEHDDEDDFLTDIAMSLGVAMTLFQTYASPW